MKNTDSERTLKAVTEFHSLWNKLGRAERGRGGLKLALARERPDLFRALRRDPALMRRLPKKVLDDWAGKKPGGVGDETLRELMPRIVAAWRHAPTPRPKLQDFVNALLAACPSAKKLCARLDELA